VPLGAITRGSTIAKVQRYLNDEGGHIWARTEIGRYLDNAYDMVSQTRCFLDWTYPENLPRGFSYTATWEKLYGHVMFDFGRATYTFADEVTEMRNAGLTDQEGPANSTSPNERTQGHLSNASASTKISATDELPSDVIEIDRVLWDHSVTESLSHEDFERSDTRYEVETGEVFGYMWRKDGVRTLRKIRVPAASAAVFTVRGSWGIMRTPGDLASDTSGAVNLFQSFSFNHSWEQAHISLIVTHDAGRATFTYADEEAAMVTASLADRVGPSNHTGPNFEATLLARAGATETVTVEMGAPKQIPDHHAFGYTPWGIPRRPYKEGTNVRVEYWRRGRPAIKASDIYELPDRYVAGLRDYAIMKCLSSPGPGQDSRLAAIFGVKWERMIGRISKRVKGVFRRRVGVFGGPGRRVGKRPPYPRLPWAFGSSIR
jgi:hypothetical protein